MSELLNSFRGSGMLANPLYFASVAVGLTVLALLFKRNASKGVIWAAAIGLTLLIAAFVFMASVPPSPFQDFTRAYWGAGEGVWSGWEGLEPHYGRGIGGFVNLPILAYVFAPFALLDAEVAALVFLALGLAALGFAWLRIAELYAFTFSERVFGLFLTGAFGPLIYSIREGNTTHLLLAPLVLGVVAIGEGKDLRAGALFAVAALFKPFLLLIGVAAFLRGRFKVALGGFVVCASAALLSLLVFGWDAHVHWYNAAIGPHSGAPLPAFNSQSIASSLSRLERGPGAYWNFDIAPLSTALRLALYGIFAVLIAATAWAVRPWTQWRASIRAFEGDIMIALILALLVSTLSWTHYFTLALLPAAWLWSELRNGPPPERLLLAIAFVLAGPIVFYGVRMGEGDFGAAFYVLGSHVCLAGLLLFALLTRARRRDVAT